MKWIAILLLSSACFAQELLRPTTDVNSTATAVGCTGSAVASSALPLARDASGLTTASRGEIGANNFSYWVRIFQGWPAPGSTYSSLSLNINAQSDGFLVDSDPGASGNACLAYSIDAGGTWTSVKCDPAGTGFARQTFTINFGSVPDLSQMRVGVCVAARGHGGKFPLAGGDDITIWDVWTLGNGGSNNSGSGSGAGNAHRGTVIVN